MEDISFTVEVSRLRCGVSDTENKEGEKDEWPPGLAGGERGDERSVGVERHRL